MHRKITRTLTHFIRLINGMNKRFYKCERENPKDLK